MGKFFKTSGVDRLKKCLNFSLLYSMFSFACGLVFIFTRNISNKYILLIISFLCCLKALELLYKFLIRNGSKIYSYNLLLFLIFAIYGTLIAFSPFLISNFISSVFGLYLILNGFIKMIYCIWLKKGNSRVWFFILVNCFLIFVLGFTIIINPFSSFSINHIIGIFLTMFSILDFSCVRSLEKQCEDIANIFW